MSIAIACSSCGARLSVADHSAGKVIPCPRCGASVAVRATRVQPPAPPAEAAPAAPASSGRTALFVVVGCGAAAALLLVVGIVVGVAIYLGTRTPGQTQQAEQTDRREAATEAPARPEEPSRLLDVRDGQPDKPAPTQPVTPPPVTPPPADNGPTEAMSKSLAAMDRLTIEVAPEDDAPTPEVWDGHTASIRGVAYTDDGRFVVSVSGAIKKGGKEDNSIRVWDARRGRQLRKLDTFREALDAVSVSPGGRFAVFGHGGHYEGDRFVNAVDHDVRLWDIQDNREVYFRKNLGDSGEADARFRGLDSSVFSTAFAPDRRRVVGVANSGKMVLWDTAGGRVHVSGQIDPVARQRLDPQTFRPIMFSLRGINCVRFTPDGRWLLMGGGDYTVRLVDAQTGSQLHTFESHRDIVWSVAAARTKDGRVLGLSGGGGQQRLRTGGFEAGARDYAIRLWDLEARREVRRFVGHEQSVNALAFCPNGRHFLSAGNDRTLRLWDLDSGKVLRTYRGHTDLIRSVSVSPDGRSAVTGGDDCTIRYWRLPATAEDVTRALEKKSHADLTAALRDADTMGPELRAAYPQLVKTLREGDKSMAPLALTLLRQLGRPEKEWAGGLGELLASPQPEARLYAAEALAQMGADARPALAGLRKALDDADPAVRRNAVAALANLGKDAPDAADDLAGLARREDDAAVRSAAVRALGKVGGKEQLKQLFRDVSQPALLVEVLDTLTAAGGLDRDLAGPLAEKGLRHTDAAVRSRALDALGRLGWDTLSLKTLVGLHLADADRDVRGRAGKAIDARLDRLTDADVSDVRDLLGQADKPEAVQIGMRAVQRLGPKAKELTPELRRRLAAAEGKEKLELALSLAAIDPKNVELAEAVGPVLVAALRPATNTEQPREDVLRAIASLGRPVVPDIFKALEAADDRGALNANNRKALFVALERLGREAHSDENVERVRGYQKKERYRDVQAAAGRALRAMLPP